MAGLSISQYKSDYEGLHGPNASLSSQVFNGYYNEANIELEEGHEKHSHTHTDVDDKTVLLSDVKQNLLRRIHPIFNVRYDKLAKAKAYYEHIRLQKSPKKKREVSDMDVTSF